MNGEKVEAITERAWKMNAQRVALTYVSMRVNKF